MKADKELNDLGEEKKDKIVTRNGGDGEKKQWKINEGVKKKWREKKKQKTKDNETKN